MRTSIIALLVLGTVAAACSSGSDPRPATVVNYGSQGNAPTFVERAAPASGPFEWHTSLATAQAAARAQGKMILAMSTKPNCGLCDKFKQKIVPQASGECSRVAVGYVYQILSPEAAQVEGTTRANLRNAKLMPLVAFLTPELRWVHGFWGPRDVNEFMQDLATARRIYPVSTARVVSARTDAPVLSAVVNEFGETEWSAPGDVWPSGDPAPIDAITGSPDMTAPVAPLPAGLPAGTMLADASPAPPPEPALEKPGVLADAERTLGGLKDDVEDVFAKQDAEAPGPPAGTTGVDWSPPPAEAPPVTAAAEPRTETPPAPASLDDSDPAAWAQRALQSALSEIRTGQYQEAKAKLLLVTQRMPNTPVAREAAKGTVAIYNFKRIQTAGTESEREERRARAQRDLGSSMWGDLFS